MTLNKLASQIAKIEGKKSQSRIGDIREILKIIQNMIKDEVIACPEVRDLPVTDCLNSKAEKWKQKNVK